MIEAVLTAAHDTLELIVPAANGAARAWLHENCEVMSETANGGDLFMTVRISKKSSGQFFKQFTDVRENVPEDILAPAQRA